VRVLVVGAGVVGLSCAVQLAEAGHHVAVLARDLPLETTSAVAAAWWYPYLAAPRERVLAWAGETYEHLDRLASRTPDTGVRQRESVQLLHRAEPDPPWSAQVPSLRPAGDLPAGYAGGWAFTAPVADTSVYLPYLVGRLTAAGGTLTRAALPGLPSGGDVVVNATGLAARALTGDTMLVPVRGQVVRLAGVRVDRVWLDEGAPSDGSGLTYIVPREHDVVVGGTADTGSWDTRADPGVTAQMIDRAARLVPELRQAHVVASCVGLRPARPAVRLELEQRAGAAPVVHCYGHGGSGVTLSWGCAREVKQLVDSLPG
jgi:D-amino-acid oxidase